MTRPGRGTSGVQKKKGSIRKAGQSVEAREDRSLLLNNRVRGGKLVDRQSSRTAFPALGKLK